MLTQHYPLYKLLSIGFTVGWRGPPGMKIAYGWPATFASSYFLIKKTAALWYKAAVRNIPVEALYGTPGTTRTYDLRIRRI
jgi:hypothetical protein